MPRQSKTPHEPYWLSMLKLLINYCIGESLTEPPRGKVQEEWFEKSMEVAHNNGQRPNATRNTLIKTYAKIRSSSSGHRFDVTTLDALCLLVSQSLDMAYIDTYDKLKLWAQPVPSGSEVQKEKIALAKLKRLMEERKQQANSLKDIGKRVNSLIFSVFELEKRLVCQEFSTDEARQIEVEQQDNIQALLFFAKHYLDSFLNEHFLKIYNESFKYDQTVLYTINLTTKLLPISKIFNNHLCTLPHLNDEMCKQLLNLRENLMKAAWASAKTEEAQIACEAFKKSIEEVEERRLLTSTQLFPYQAAYLSYASCYDTHKLDEYHRFVNALVCPIDERELYVFRYLKCTACAHIRNKRYTDARTILERVKVECRMIYELPKRHKPLMGSYHYQYGQVLYFLGTESWPQAMEHFWQALNYWREAGMEGSVESAYIYHLLSEIKRQEGAVKEAQEWARKAKEILVRNAKLNTCSLDVQGLCHRLQVSPYSGQQSY